MRRWLFLWAGLACAGLAVAADPPAPPAAVPEAEQGEGVSLTVYNENLVVVKERRLMDLRKGRSTVRFRDVAATIVPETVQFTPLRRPDLARVVEQNYEFDLVGADKLLQKYVDHDVKLVTRDGEELPGTLLSFDDQQLVLRTAHGIDLVPRAGNVKDVQFGSLPGGLLTRPTLVWQLDAKEEGRELVKVAYQAKNMSWHVDYRARVNEAGDRLDLGGWVTVTNNTGTTFKDAGLKLLAGDVHLVLPPPPPPLPAPPGPGGGGGGGPAFVEKTFSEFHLYELGRPTTLRDQQTKQIELLDVRQVPVRRQYQVGDGGKVAVTLEFKNSPTTAAGLGVPLPKGPVRVFQRDADGELELAGLDNIDHTPKDEPLRLHLGHATDLAGERKETAYRRAGLAGEWYDIEVRLRNHKTEAVTIDVVETIHGDNDATVVKQSHPYTRRDVNTLVFPVQVKPNAEIVLTYTIHYVQPIVPLP
jgi:hypothetical protein